MNKNLKKTCTDVEKEIRDNRSDRTDIVQKQAQYKDIFRAALKAYNGGNQFASLDTVYRSTQNMRSQVGRKIKNNEEKQDRIRIAEEPNQYVDVILNHFLLTDYNDYSLPDYNSYTYRDIVSEEEYNEFKTKALERYNCKQKIFQKILDHYNIDKEQVKSFLNTKVFNKGVVIGVS